jgi:hypothetical protein
MPGSNNAIGTGALVVSANIDKLGSGLAAAEAKIGGFGGKVGGKGQAGGLIHRMFFGSSGTGGILGTIGGIFGRIKSLAGGLAGKPGGGGLLGSILTGGVAGLAAAAGGKLFQTLFNLPDLIKKVSDKARGTDTGALGGILQSFNKLSDAGEKLIVKVMVAMAPAFTRFADIALDALDRFGPTIDKILEAFGAYEFVAAEVFGEIIDLVGKVIEQVVEWIDQIAGVANTTEGTGQAVFKILRMLGKGYAYVWDTVKAGAGIVAWVTGKIIQGLAWVIKQLAKAIEFVAEVADRLPAKLRNQLGLNGLRPAADAVRKFGGEVDQVGEKFEQWGTKQIEAFGESAPKIDAWFDGVEKRFKQRKEELKKVVMLESPKLAGTEFKDSVGAYSVIAKFQAGNLVAADNAKALVQVNKQNGQKLDAILKELQNLGLGSV